MTNPKTTIHWNTKERVVIAESVKQQVAATGAKIRLHHVKTAMELLPAERRRNLTGLQDLGAWFKGVMESIHTPGLLVKSPEQASGELASIGIPAAIVSSLYASGVTTIAELLAMREQDVLTIRQLGPKALEQIEEKLFVAGLIGREETPAVVSDMKSIMMSLAEAMVDRLESEMRGALAEVMQSRYPSSPAHRLVSLDSSKTRKKKVIVIGPYNGDVNRVTEKFKDKFSLVIFNKDKSPEVLRSNLSNADAVFIMAGHTTHAITDMVKARYAGKPIMVNGGYTSLSNEMESFQ